MGRSPCCSKEGLNRGAWTAMEDKILTDYIQMYGEGKWRNLPKRAGLKRCGKSCRLRWLNYLRPDIKRGNISLDEEELIIRLHKLLGNRWSLIAGRLPGRTDNEIKNYWNTNIGKKIQGNPSSTTCRKTSEKAKTSSPTPTARHSAIQPSKVTNPINPHVVRTKASKCTKAVLFPHHHAPENLDDDTTVVIPPCVDIDQVNDDQMVAMDLQPSLFMPLISDENNSSELITSDFELDENFLSDFLDNIDFLHLTYNLGTGGEDNINNNNNIATGGSSEFEKGQSSSPKSDHDHQNLLFSQDHMLYGVDLESMTSIDDPQVLDWLQD